MSMMTLLFGGRRGKACREMQSATIPSGSASRIAATRFGEAVTILTSRRRTTRGHFDKHKAPI
jgi:hypothetical protein